MRFTSRQTRGPLLAALAVAVTSTGMAFDSTLHPRQQWGSPKPVDITTSVQWARSDPAQQFVASWPGLAGHMNSILSLISDNHRAYSFAAPLLTILQATTSSLATQQTSQSTGEQVRVFNSSAGSPWAAAFHAEVHHGAEWTPGHKWDTLKPNASGTSIDFNGEFERFSAKGFVVGLELNNPSWSLPPDVGVELRGRFKTGVDLGGNRLVLAPGVWVDVVDGLVCVHRDGRIVARF